MTLPRPSGAQANDEFDARQLEPMAREVYQNIDLNRLCVYTINLLQENACPVMFETLVVALFRMFPDKFALVGFPEYPDAARVNRALLQLRPKYRNWAHGSIQQGFVLTVSGKAVVDQTRELLENPELQTSGKTSSPARTRDIEKEIGEVLSSKLFEKYSSGYKAGDPQGVHDVLKTFPYTQKRVIKKRLADLKGVARQGGREDVVGFLNWVERSHPGIFR